VTILQRNVGLLAEWVSATEQIYVLAADWAYVSENLLRQLPDTTRRLLVRALWRRQVLIVHNRTDLGQGSNRCAPPLIAMWRTQS